MKISYQQLCIMFLCMTQQISAVTLYNKSHSIIRFNIFKKDIMQKNLRFNIFPKHFGKIASNKFFTIKDLDPQSDYIVTFYDVYNCKNNKVFTIKGNARKLSFKIDTNGPSIA